MRGSRFRRVALVAAVAIGLSLAAGCDATDEPSPAPDVPLTLGVSRETMAALAYIARDNDAFAMQGLDVTVKEYESGQQVLEAVVDGEVDVAQCADTPIVLGALEGSDVTIFATVATDLNDIKVVARADSGIVVPEDLRGKRIGTRKGTAAEFFLHLLLIKHGLSEEAAEMRYGTFDEVTQSLIAGEIDAVALRQPFVSQLEEALGENYVLLEEPGLYEKTMNLCVSTDSPAIDADVQARLVRAMIEAERIAASDAEAARRQVASDLALRPEDLCDCILIEGAVALRQSLILTLEDQARWALEAKGSDVSPPNFFARVNTSVLESIDPERVTVIR